MTTLTGLTCLLLVAVASASEPTLIRKVRHEPVQPKPDVPVLVTANVAKGTTKVTLKLQEVAPGKYVRKSDPAYQKEWTDFPMHDDGKEGDEKAGDRVYSLLVPARYQRHRWLVRYRIEAVDQVGQVELAPAASEACPNQAWWCDSGPATWTGSREPGRSPKETFSAEFLGTLQSMHLLARAEDVARSQWDGNFHKQKQQGTLVYRGVVYDHIQFSNRGQGSAHISGKNKWGLKFNDEHEVPLFDHDGVPFPHTCDSLNLNPGGSTPYLPILRGISGLDEVMSMRAYRLAGVPSPAVTWVQWRVVDGADEVSAKDQYEGDLWGLYVVVGDMEPKLLADPALPDGLTVSAQSGVKHAPRGVTNGPQEWEKFLHGMRSNLDEAWWRKNLDLRAYFSFHAMNRLLGNVDLRPDGNHGYYQRPHGSWMPIPWDNDMMFVPRHHQPGHIEAIGCLNHPKIALEYRNRAREILDLFAADRSERGGQVGQLTHDLARGLAPKGHPVDWSRLDEAVWNHHPRMNQKGSYFVNPSYGDHFGGRWTRTLATNDFAGFQKYLIDFCTDSRPKKNYAPNDGDHRGYGWGYVAHEAKDDEIPAKPNVERMVAGGSRFQATAFVSPKRHAASALEWRVGRVGQLGWYELANHWSQDVESTEASSKREIDIPTEAFKVPGQYRVRARWRDTTGRCSHWSDPVEVAISEK